MDLTTLPFEYEGRYADHFKMLGFTLEQAAFLEQRDRDLEDYLATLGGSNKPYATYVIAASDSVAADKANADYVCDGTDDDVQIQAAIDALSDAGMGGKVLLLEGTYTFGTSGVSLTGGVTLEGMGWGSIIDPANVTAQYVIAVTGSQCAVRNLYISGDNLGGTPTYGIWTWGSAFVVIQGVKIFAVTNGIYASAGNHLFILDNTLDNQVTNGIELTSAITNSRWIVRGNIIQVAGGDGISIAADSGIVAGNVCDDNGSDGIALSGDNVLCMGNVCDNNTGYGINVAAGTGNRVAGNTLRGNTLAPLIDSGTSTQLTFPGHATYGDNWS